MLLKKGSRGEDVKKVQKALNLIADGIFGPLTEEAVKVYQRENNLMVDGIVGDKTFAKLFPAQSNPRQITEIIVHCSATPEGKDYTVKDIDSWHRARGFNQIGYHWVIYRSGEIVPARSESLIGAHCTGHNAKSIGVCYIGGMDKDNKAPKDTRTPEQKESLIKLLKELKSRYPGARVIPHNKYAVKACPCFDAEKEYINI